MKCKNCGAELNNGRCEYCGSFFAEDMRLFTLKPPQINEDIIRKALRTALISVNPYREDDSRMHKAKIKDVIEVTSIGDTERHFIEGI